MDEIKRVKLKKGIDIALMSCAGVSLLCALILTFTIGDYYVFSRFAEFGAFFCLSHWVKKAGLIMIALAVFFKSRRCAATLKYFLPVFIIVNCFIYGGFFEIAPPPADGNVNFEIFNNLNDFFPVGLNKALYFIESIAMLACCVLLFIRDGFKIEAMQLTAIPLAIGAAMPLNIFENFFDINDIPSNSFLRFYNFTLWHFLAICVLVGVTVGVYFFLKNKEKSEQDKWLVAIAVTLLLQYHSKDSMLLSDGYNVYKTVFAVIPLFICNIGVYVSCLSVIFKRKFLYAISFFVHAVGALTVFVYFGKNDMSNYGIFCSYSILYFCLTHCLLFALCVIPSALGHYKFVIKDCIIPLGYYFVVIILASVASTLVSNASVGWVTAGGEHLVFDGVYVQGGVNDNPAIGDPGYMKPNFAFTQTNPLPIDIPNIIPLGGAFAYINLFYVFLVYIAYVCLFFAFYGAYILFLKARKFVLEKLSDRLAERLGKEGGTADEVVDAAGEVVEESAAADEERDE